MCLILRTLHTSFSSAEKLTELRIELHTRRTRVQVAFSARTSKFLRIDRWGELRVHLSYIQWKASVNWCRLKRIFLYGSSVAEYVKGCSAPVPEYRWMYFSVLASPPVGLYFFSFPASSSEDSTLSLDPSPRNKNKNEKWKNHIPSLHQRILQLYPTGQNIWAACGLH